MPAAGDEAPSAQPEALANAGAKVLGALLNRIPVRARADYADYYGAYGGESATLTQARSTDKQPERSAP